MFVLISSKSSVNVLIVDQAVTFGGSIVVMANIANNLSEEFSCSVIYEIPSPMANYLFNGNVHLHRIHNLIDYLVAGKVSASLASVQNKRLRILCFKIFAIGKYFTSFYQIFRIARVILADNIDIVHSNNSREAILAAKFLRKKIVLHLHGISDIKKDPARDKADIYLSISENVKGLAIEKNYDENKIITLPNPVVSRNVDFIKKTSYMNKFRISETDNIFGMVGRIVDWKGQLEFIDAVKIVVSELKNVKVLIIGDVSDGADQYFLEVKSKIIQLGLQDYIYITGYIEDVQNVMATLNLLVHCSIEPEPFGLVITEAMDLGIPVIAANIGAPLEIIKDKRTGFLVDPLHAEKMAELIIRLLTDKKLAQVIGQSGKRDVAKRYNITTYTNQLTDIYKELIA